MELLNANLTRISSLFAALTMNVRGILGRNSEYTQVEILDYRTPCHVRPREIESWSSSGVLV